MRDKNTREAKRPRKLARLMADENSHWTARALSRSALEARGDVAEWIPKVPRKIASELALAGLPFELTPHMLDLMYRAFTVIKPASFTIETVLVANWQKSLYCFDNLSQNPGLAYSMLFTAQCLHDSTTQNGGYSSAAQLYMAKALAHLRHDLQANSRTNATMAVVVSLASSAMVLQDIDMMMKHMDGLYQLISLRGGLESLGDGSMVEHKAQRQATGVTTTLSCAGRKLTCEDKCRLDFGISLATGRPSRFFRHVSWGPHIALDAATQCQELKLACPDLDPKMRIAWADLREFSKVANEATRTNVKMSIGFFSRLLQSVPYRLLAVEFDLLSNSELLRLCMLAYVKELLIPVKGFGKYMTYIVDRIKMALLAHQLAPGKESDELLLWALFVTALALYDNFDREWIQEMMAITTLNLGLRTWEEVRAVLKRFLWIDIILDAPAKGLFDQWWEQGTSS